MFQFTSIKVILILLLAASLGVFWYLDTKYYHWDRVLPNPQELVVEDAPSPTVNDTFKSKEFVPTNEWQVIGKDQAIPPGLHVQIDLQTGEKKAKLLDDNKNSKTSSLAIASSNDSLNIEQSKIMPDNLHKFKSYEELKKDMKELNMTMKSDMEIMNDLSKQFHEQMKTFEDSDKNLKNILTDLEYLLHQVDTAEVFVKNKGIEQIIIPCINSNSSFMKAQGALILGSAASNNPKVQIAAYEAKVVPILLKHIGDEFEFSVKKNCFYALSSITRRFPLAQNQLVEKNGIKIFMSVFKEPESMLNTKLKVKITQLLEDLVIETEDAKLTMQEETNEQLSLEAKERFRQYNDLNLKDKLVENGWCEILGSEFIKLSNSLPMNEENQDMVEASGKSLLAISELCKTKLQENNSFFKSLTKLESYYKKLFQQDNFFSPLYHLMNDLTNTYDPVLE